MRPRVISILLSLFILFLSCACITVHPSSTTVQSSPGKEPQGSGSFDDLSRLAHLHLPPGFQISVYASGLHSPRFMTVGPDGVLLVADAGSNAVIALPPGTSPEHAGMPIVIGNHLDQPTSLTMQGGYLYISEASSVARLALGSGLRAGPIQDIISHLPVPQGQLYGTHTVLIAPDNQVYVSSSSSDCSACVEQDPHSAAVWEYGLDGSGGRLFASGLPNAVGMAVNPWMGQIWADVNGSNLLAGTAVLPETVYSLSYQGNYGWPRCYAGVIPNPAFGQSPDACKGVQQPVVTLQAHSTPLGMAFYPLEATQFPERYRNSLYVALHGSDSRSLSAGDKIVRIPIDCGKMAGRPEDFLSGWLNSNGTSNGRPMGITFADDGSMFISDDQTGLIYHVWYQG
jgi:glucose/arabinose dehydrogenase